MSAMSELDIKVQESKGKKIHYIDVRLRNNAAMDYPTCKVNSKMLELDAQCLPLSGDIHAVTCKQCLRVYFKGSRS